MTWPKKEVIIDVFLAVAHEAGMDSSSQHPEDIMIAMVNALEGAAKTIEIMSKKKLL